MVLYHFQVTYMEKCKERMLMKDVGDLRSLYTGSGTRDREISTMILVGIAVVSRARQYDIDQDR